MISRTAGGVCVALAAGWLAGAQALPEQTGALPEQTGALPEQTGALPAQTGAPANAAARLFESVEPHMGTLVRIKLYAADEEQARGAFRAAFNRIAQLDAALSDYKPESEISRLTREPAGEPVIVSQDLFRVLKVSQQLAEKSGGAFDVTLGPLTRLWRQARKEGRRPGREALREAASRCGYRNLQLDPQRRTVTIGQPGMQLDLGAIAKGYAADAALEALRGRGIQNALVAASGDIVCGDPPPGKRGWRVAARPLPELTADSAPVLLLRNAAVSTSGSAEQYFDSGGRRYSHIVDPASSEGVTRHIGATVIASSGMLADALATAVNVLGPERGIALIDRERDATALIAIREGGSVRLMQSSRFDVAGGKSVVGGRP